MKPTIGVALLSQPFLASDVIGTVFCLLALVYGLLWRRDQNSGFAWFACTWLFTGFWWLSTPYQPLAGPFIAWSPFWYLFFPALFTLAFGLVAYLKVPQAWHRRTVLWVGVPILVFITTYHLPLFGFQIQRSVANLSFGLYYCALGSLAMWAGERERGAGHRIVAIALWAIPLVSLGLAFAGVDAPILKYYAALPLFLLSITLLTATLLRRQWSLENEVVRRAETEVELQRANKQLTESAALLERMAHFDELTHLPNRLLLRDRLTQAMGQARRRDKKLAVAFIDLDSFKSVNDSHGHDVGDKFLNVQANAIKSCMREGDTLARIGGDEFVAVLIDLEGLENQTTVLDRILLAAAAKASIENIVLQGSASIGVTFYPQAQDIDADQLLRQADQAMYQAKLTGRNRYHLFDSDHDSHLRGHHENLEGIRRALERREFVLHYQPKVNMRTGEVIGAEALIRWQHPEKGLLAPGIFLPIIENDPLSIAVGEWVIDTALSQIEQWSAAGLDLSVSVNMGAQQLLQIDFIDRLRAILSNHPKFAHGRMQIEVLETSALEDISQISRVIAECEKLGVAFSLDDFGTGYSSLTYLKRLKVAQLKIDQSFVRDMLVDPDDLAILEGVIGLASAFKRQVIAEGVETVAHGTALLALGCELAQGYGIARPMPAEQLSTWAKTWRPDSAWSEYRGGMKVNSPHFSTQDVKQAIFPAHGFVNVSIEGNVARYEAWGPFNEELVAAYIAVQEQVIPAMAAKTRWGDLSIFHRSMMASPGTLASFAEDLKACAFQGLAPYATAFVIGPDVEGDLLMGPLFARCYSDAGLLFKVFQESSKAEEWLQSKLAVANPAVSVDDEG